MGVGKNIKSGIDLLEDLLREVNKPAKAAVKAVPVAPTLLPAVPTVQAPAVMIPSRLNEIQEKVRKGKGAYGAKRVERAADEIKNLERLYTTDALKEAFIGDNARALMTMNPNDFEKYATPIPKGISGPQEFRGFGNQFHNESMKSMTLSDYLDNLANVKGGFADVPYLIINKEEQGLPLTPFISGHEGRHRNRALSKQGEETGLVQLLPRSELREPFPRRDQEEYIEALRKELGMTDNLVLPQKYNEATDSLFDKQIQRPAIKLPDIYAEGGEVHMGSNKKMPNDEAAFQNWIRGTDWFKEFKSEYNEEPDLDTKDYDYRAAWKAGVQPERDPYDNNRFHWPSSLPTGEMLKSAEHPTAWKEYFMRETGVNPDALGLKTPEEANIFIENSSKGQEKAAGGEVNKGRAASIGGEEFYNAALAAGLPLDNDTLNKIVDLVNAGHSVSKAAKLVKGGSEVHMMGGGRPPKKTTLEEDLKSFKDPAIALADLLAGALRGTTTAATGFAGDMEELYRQYGKGAVANAVRLMLPKREGKETTFPTIEEMNAMLPPVVPAGSGRSTQVADVGQFLGENNPLAPTALAMAKPVARAVKAAAPYVARGAIDLAKSEPARRAVDRVMQATGASPRQIMAYQGSPHLYAATPNNPLGELDPTKIGSGEGAQAYGMGHYLAENRNVGQEYRNSISSQHGQDVTVNGIPVDEYYMKVYGNADQLPIEEARQQYDKAALIEMLSFNRSPNDILSYAEDVGYAPSVIDWFKTDVIPKTKMPGYLYTHDLSDEAISRMLDWDKPLSQQSQHVKDALEKSDYAFKDMAYDITGDPDPTGGYIVRTGMNPKEFAEHMRSLGIPGVKYLDQNSKARQSMDPEFTEGTRNFVLFPGEEGASKIIRREKTGGAVMMADGGMITIEEFLRKQGY